MLTTWAGGFLRVDFLSAKYVQQILCGVPQNTKVCPAEKFFLVGKYANATSLEQYRSLAKFSKFTALYLTN